MLERNEIMMNYHLLDLTHPVSGHMPIWPGDPKTHIKQIAHIEREGYNLNRLSIGEHSGTHIGSPRHFCANGTDMSAYRPDELFITAIKMDVSSLCSENPDYLLLPDHILQWEQKYHRIPDGVLFILQTSWSRFWGEPDIYLGRKQKELHFPGISVEAGDMLIGERKVIGLGIDTHGIDGGQSKDFAVNILLAEHNLFHIENLTNLEKLSETGAWIFIGALPIKNGCGSPCRVVAFIQKPV